MHKCDIYPVFLVAALAVDGQSRVPAGSKVFIAPMEGKLDGFIAPEIIKKRLPLVVVTDEKDAEHILTGASIKADDKWYHVIFGGKDKNEGNVRLLSVKDHQMVWADEAGDRSLWWGRYRRGGERKVADRIVKEMKKALFSGFMAEAWVPASPTPAQTEAHPPNAVVRAAPAQPAAPPRNPPSTTPAATGDRVLNIAFTSTPANALVTIGGMAIGRTPFTTKLPTGFYSDVLGCRFRKFNREYDSWHWLSNNCECDAPAKQRSVTENLATYWLPLPPQTLRPWRNTRVKTKMQTATVAA